VCVGACVRVCVCACVCAGVCVFVCRTLWGDDKWEAHQISRSHLHKSLVFVALLYKQDVVLSGAY